MAICRFLGLVTLGLFFITAFTPFANLLSRWMGYAPQLEPADAIVVLGAGGVRGDGTLSDSSLRRAIHGILLYQSGLAPLLVLSGPAGSEGPPEAEVRAALARRLGVPAEVILTEASGHTTREEAAALGAVLRSRGVRRVLLVADWEGMGRARGLFERAGLAVLPAPDEARGWSGTPEGRLKIMRLVLQEALAGLYYRVAGYL